MKVVCTGDWHADVSTMGVPRFDEVKSAAEQSVAHAVALKNKREEVAYVFGGDLCETEGPGTFRTLQLAIECAGELAAYDIGNFWLTGNHDVFEDGLATSVLTPMMGMNGVTVIDRPMTVVKGMERPVRLAFLPFTPHSHDYDPAAFVEEASDISRAEFHQPHGYLSAVFGHLMLEGIGPGSETRDMPRGRNVFWPLDALKTYWPDAVLVGGHYHQQQCFRGVHVVGSLARLTRGEVGGQPCFMEIDV